MENKCSLLAVEAVHGLPLNRGVCDFKVFKEYSLKIFPKNAVGQKWFILVEIGPEQEMNGKWSDHFDATRH